MSKRSVEERGRGRRRKWREETNEKGKDKEETTGMGREGKEGGEEGV